MDWSGGVLGNKISRPRWLIRNKSVRVHQRDARFPRAGSTDSAHRIRDTGRDSSQKQPPGAAPRGRDSPHRLIASSTRRTGFGGSAPSSVLVFRPVSGAIHLRRRAFVEWPPRRTLFREHALRSTSSAGLGLAANSASLLTFVRHFVPLPVRCTQVGVSGGSSVASRRGIMAHSGEARQTIFAHRPSTVHPQSRRTTLCLREQVFSLGKSKNHSNILENIRMSVLLDTSARSLAKESPTAGK